MSTDQGGVTSTRKDEIALLRPTGTSGTAVSSTVNTPGDVVLAATEVLMWPNITVYVKNAGGGAAANLDGVTVQASPDNVLWITVTSLTGLALASGSGKYIALSGNSFRYVRVGANVAASNTTVDAYITGNKG